MQFSPWVWMLYSWADGRTIESYSSQNYFIVCNSKYVTDRYCYYCFPVEEFIRSIKHRFYVKTVRYNLKSFAPSPCL